MLFEGVPMDLASLLQTLILWPDLEKKKKKLILTSMYAPNPAPLPPKKLQWYSLETQHQICSKRVVCL